MNANLFEELLNEEESATLDFKREQYKFARATDDEKSEIIKDILIFANAWRRTDAYILIGVEEVKGGRSNVVGVTHHIDDANIQQLVNSKTQRPVTFSYEAFPFEGKQVGVITIPLQERPFYLNKNYGKLTKKVVYIRRGSSTDIAEIDEIAKMGTSSTPRIESPERPVIYIVGAGIDSDGIHITPKASYKNSSNYIAKNVVFEWAFFVDGNLEHQGSEHNPIVERDAMVHVQIPLKEPYTAGIRTQQIGAELELKVTYESITRNKYFYRARYPIPHDLGRLKPTDIEDN